jgi:hypothetical protein
MDKLHFGIRLIMFGFLLVTLRGECEAQNPDRSAPERYGWGFRNFGDSLFAWDIYSHSFFGVPLDSNGTWLTAPFDKLFYDQAFRTKLPNPGNTANGIGNCYGLSLLSLMMNKFGGYYGYCSPPSAYRGDTNFYNATGPDNQALHRIINIMHGHQLSLASIESYIDQAMSGHSEDPNYGVELARQAIGKEGPCIVSITKTVNPLGGGHSLIAYGVTQSGSQAKIWVVDPNRLWAVDTPRDRGWYQADSNYIECDLAGQKWKFIMAGGDLYPSDPKGHLIILPVSMIGPPGRVPSSLGLAVGEILSKAFLTDEMAR